MTNLSLVQALRKETETMKIEYLKNISIWAVQEFNKIVKLQNDFYDKVIPRRTMEWVRVEKFLWNQGHKIIQGGVEKFIEKQTKEAEEHYENSILKLSAKIESKGLNLEKLEVKSGRVGINFETTLTDGEKVVRAFTIIAEGEIVKPHYRYLIK